MPPNICRTIPQKQLISLKAAFAARCGYCPSEGQAQIHQSTKRFRVCVAGARFGKSMAEGFEIAFHLQFPNFRSWIVAPVYNLADKEFDWVMHFLAAYKRDDGRSLYEIGKICDPNKGPRNFSTPWGSFVETKSTENPEQLLGEELDLIAFGEGAYIPRKVWENQLRARIGPREGQLLAFSTGNSDSGLFSDFVANGFSDDPETKKDWQSWAFKTLDNPTFSISEWERAKRELDPTVFDEQYGGKLVSRRGLVFSFSEEKHVAKKLPDGCEGFPVLISIQPGYKNPCAVVFIMYDRASKQYLVYDEIFVKEVLVQDIVAEIKKRVVGKRVLGFLSDYWERDALNEFAKFGIGLSTNEEEKKVGKTQATIMRVRALQNMLKFREDGSPRLKIFSKCENTIGDFQKCKWPDKPKEESDRLEAETPLPRFFQAPQAVSHVISFLEAGAGVNIYESKRK